MCEGIRLETKKESCHCEEKSVELLTELKANLSALIKMCCCGSGKCGDANELSDLHRENKRLKDQVNALLESQRPYTPF